MTSALKRLRASELQGSEAGSACTPCVVDCLHVLCRWRDQQARQLDQGDLAALAAAEIHAIVLALEASLPCVPASSDGLRKLMVHVEISR